MKRLSVTVIVSLMAACEPPVARGPAVRSTTAPASPQWKLDATPLAQGHPLQSAIRAGETHRYSVALAAGEVVMCTVDQRGVDLVLTLIDPRGGKIRDVDSPNGNLGPEPAVLDASLSGAGTYYIEVKAFEVPPAEGAAPALSPAAPLGTYEARIDERLTEAAYAGRRARVAIPSNRLFRVWQEVQAGHGDALERFFAEYKDHAPLVEPLEDDADQVLVTIVARADAKKPYLGLVGVPYADEVPMLKLPGLDAWYYSMRMPRDARFLYSLVDAPLPTNGTDIFRARRPHSDNLLADPFAKTTFGNQSVATLPGAPPQPWVARRDGVASGEMHRLEMRTSRLPETRTIGVYTPAGYDPKLTYPLVVVFDGEVYGLDPKTQLLPLPTILDNLVAAKKIPPIVAVFVDQQGIRNRDLTMSDAFSDFVALDVIPKVRRDFHAGLTARDTVVAGSSYGGLCSAFVGLKHADVVGNVLSQSGAFAYSMREYEVDEKLTTERALLISAYVAAKHQPLKLYLDVGRFEAAPFGGILEANRHFRDVLLAKGYAVTYAEYNGNHDYASWRGTISDGLMALLLPAK